MYSRLDLNNPNSPEIVYSDSHVAITCYFTVSGTPVDVTSPTFSLYAGSTTGDPDVTSSLTILRPIQKDPSNLAGKYLITFLTKTIAAGSYLAVMKGTYNSVEVTATSTLTFQTISRQQWMIETLLSSLKGKYNLLIPDNLLVIDPRSRTWSDGECYTFLNRAMMDVNATPPLLSTNFSFDSSIWPVEIDNLLFIGAQIHALFAAASLDAQNYFDIQVPIKVSLYRGDKFVQLMTFLRDSYQKAITGWKEQYWFHAEAEEMVLVMGRVPVRITRPICLSSGTLFWHCQDGFKPIEMAKIGDQVITRVGEIGTIIGVNQSSIKDFAILKSGGQIITLSQNHRLLVSNGSCDWKMVKDIEAGDRLVRLSGLKSPEEIIIDGLDLHHTEIPELMYDITVSDGGSFVIGGNIISHNSDELNFHKLGF